MKSFTESAGRALMFANSFASMGDSSYIGTEHILLGLIREERGTASAILKLHKVSLERVLELMRDSFYPGDGAMLEQIPESASREYSVKAAAVLDEAEHIAIKTDAVSIGTEHILTALFVVQDCTAVRLLYACGLDTAVFCRDAGKTVGGRLASYVTALGDKKRNSGGKGTPMLDQYGRDLTALASQGKLDPVSGRQDEIERVLKILSRRLKNNPCLVGEPGVGKTAIAEAVAARLAEGTVPDGLKDKRLVSLDLSGMVAGSRYRGEFEERIKRLMAEVEREGNVILFMDEIHTIVGAGSAEGSIDASNILKPALARGELRMIGATTTEEYRKYFSKDAALERRFQPVDIDEPSVEETIEILRILKSKYEEYHGVIIEDEALVAAAELSARYIADRFLPDKAIDVMDEACAEKKLGSLVISPEVQSLRKEAAELDEMIEDAIALEEFRKAGSLKKKQMQLKEKARLLETGADGEEKRPVVGREDAASCVSVWSGVPVNRLNEEESEKLLKLGDELKKRVTGQDEAVDAVVRAVRRSRTGISEAGRPVGSFLFLGPTGVGKTELSKALAEILFGTEDALIRVDMSEYMEAHSVSKMIGSPPGYVGYDNGGQLSGQVRRHPYSVVLFDEIEKAHPDVFNLLLQVLDDGHITDSRGKKISFKNTIIIMTSNAGAKEIVAPKRLGFSFNESATAVHERMKSNVMDEVKRLFKPEFLNRIDETIVFKMLDDKAMEEIVSMLTKDLADRVSKGAGIELSFTKQLKQFVAKKDSDPIMGARPLRRAVRNRIEDPLSEKILSGVIKAGDHIKADIKAEEICFEIKEKKSRKKKTEENKEENGKQKTEQKSEQKTVKKTDRKKTNRQEAKNGSRRRVDKE